MNTTASVQRQNMLVHLSLELSVPRGSLVSLSEEIMFTDKYPCIFLREIVTIVYLMHENVRKTNEREKSIQRNKTLINEIKI